MKRITDDEIEAGIYAKIEEIRYNEPARNKFLREVGKAICKSQKNKESILNAIKVLTYIAEDAGWIGISDNDLIEEDI